MTHADQPSARAVDTTPTYLLDPEILRRIEPSGVVERVRTRQAAVLSTMLHDARLSRLANQSAMSTATSPAYTIDELLTDLSRGIFSELEETNPGTDEYRRNLQREFVEQMDRLISTPLSPTGGNPQGARTRRPADARALARATLSSLDSLLEEAVQSAVDRVTAAHFGDLRARIDEILDPR